MIGIGTDILQLSRIDATLARQGERFVRRILAPTEQVEYENSARPNRLLAKRFAAKEAVVKALGTGIGNGVSWQDIIIEHDELGAPTVVLEAGAAARAKQLGGGAVLLSLADEQDYVVAFAVLIV